MLIHNQGRRNKINHLNFTGLGEVEELRKILYSGEQLIDNMPKISQCVRVLGFQ